MPRVRFLVWVQLSLRRRCIVPAVHTCIATVYPGFFFFSSLEARTRGLGSYLRGEVRQEIHGDGRERNAIERRGRRRRKRARWKMGGESGEREKPLTHNTIRRLRLLRWILKDLRDYYFFLFFHFHSSIIISEERGADGCALASARACFHHVCIRLVCMCVCTFVCVFIYVCLHACMCLCTCSLVPG